jgi:hypothetical protein
MHENTKTKRGAPAKQEAQHDTRNSFLVATHWNQEHRTEKLSTLA